ncbi:type II toxin-antitoxin system Phd/YefM family antitoxin [Anaerophaga thermohalophila]|uniref:type II toxin-antitoxin system Phd/YefM family antitoxin n=1 Tax=Anaerophaga thermohalophila TaxID=177400 RepID=UPI0002E0535E|nr:type II toxin-antitoxin system Phd/YefM family antitoxin [Anaerophaga thermohalophila]
MRVISSAELRNNMKKYLDLAGKEQIIIQRGRKETFVLKKREYLEPDEDFNRAISLEQFREGAKEHIKTLFSEK